MRQAVYGTARLGLHREFSDRMKVAQGGGDLSALKSAGSAMVSGALASVIGTPFDVSLVRMQADGMKPVAERRGYKNVFDALVRISREEGVGKLWRGFEPTAFRAVAMNVGMMASYDQAKQVITKVRGGGGGGGEGERGASRARILTHSRVSPPSLPLPPPLPPDERRQRRHAAHVVRRVRPVRVPDIPPL
jgi:solute carrier family 25 (mitochondrial oxoglutarate transporter), member 11